MDHLLGGSIVGLMVTSSKRAYATCCVTQVCCSQSPCPRGRSLLTCASSGDTQTLKDRSGSVSVGSLGPGAHKVLFEPSERLWQVWGLILNVILPLLLSCWGFPFALGHELSPQSCSNTMQPPLQHHTATTPAPTTNNDRTNNLLFALFQP